MKSQVGTTPIAGGLCLSGDLEPLVRMKRQWSHFGGLGQSAIVILALLILAGPLLWAVDRVTLFFFAKSYVGEIAEVFNLDQHLARALSLGLWAILLLCVSRLFSLSKANRQVGFYGILALLFAHALVLSYGVKNQFFEASSGKATKCYVITRQGEVRYLEHPGVDPVTGRICRVYTQETVERLQAYAKGQRPQRVSDLEPEFFDPRTGEPVIWYHKDREDRIELFNLMGFHPESGEELLPITAEVIRVYKEQTQRRASPPQRIQNIDEFQLFDTATGHPRAWFWRGPNGKYEFFDNQGFHPDTGDALKPFTSQEISKWKKEKQLAREYDEQEEKRLRQEEQLRKDAEERRLAREQEAAERAEKTAAEKEKQAAEAVEACDRLAANPHDPKKPSNILGARFGEVKESAEAAAGACKHAKEFFPDEPRYQYQFARAIGFSNPDEAIAIYRALTKKLYPAAFDNLASLLLQRRDKKSIKEAIVVLKDGVRHGDPDSMVTLAALAGTSEFPVQNPYAFKLMLYKQAASLGNSDAKEAAEELERQADQQRQEYISRRQQEQMMLDLFGFIVGGVLQGR